MNEAAVAALAEILDVPRGEARAVIKALRDRGYRVWAERPIDRLAEWKQTDRQASS